MKKFIYRILYKEVKTAEAQVRASSSKEAREKLEEKFVQNLDPFKPDVELGKSFGDDIFILDSTEDNTTGAYLGTIIGKKDFKFICEEKD